MRRWGHRPVATVIVVIGLASVSLMGCEFPYRNLDKFKAEADHRETVVAVAIARLYQCFLQNGHNSGWQSLNEAEWWATKGPAAHLGLVEFRRINGDETRVTMYGLPGSPYHYGIAGLTWRVEHCRKALEAGTTGTDAQTSRANQDTGRLQ